MGAHLKPRHPEQGSGCSNLARRNATCCWRYLEESEEAGFESAERKWRLEPTAATGVVQAGKEKAGTQALLPSPGLPTFLECLSLLESNRKPAGPGKWSVQSPGPRNGAEYGRMDSG